MKNPDDTPPLITRKSLRAFANWSCHVTLPAWKEDKILLIYKTVGGDFDDEGRWHDYTEQDVWEQIGDIVQYYAKNIKPKEMTPVEQCMRSHVNQDVMEF